MLHAGIDMTSRHSIDIAIASRDTEAMHRMLASLPGDALYPAAPDLVRLAAGFEAEGRLDDALLCRDLVVRAWSGRATPLIDRARLQLRMHRMTEALADCDAAVACDADAGGVSVIRAQVQEALGNIEDAIASYRAAIKESGGSDSALQARILALDAISKAKPDAIRFDPALLVDPSMPASVEAFRRDGLVQHLRRYSAHQHVRNAIHRLQDAHWLAQWDQAIIQLKGRRVAMHGSGLGVLALRALESGARHVLCIEPSAQNARIAAGLSHKHHLAAWHASHGDSVKQWDETMQRASFEAFSAGIDVVALEDAFTPMPDRDAFVFTDFDHTLLGTGIVPALRAFLAGREESTAPLLLPAKARVHAMAVQWCDPIASTAPSPLDARRWSAYPQPFDLPITSWRALTLPTPIIEIDFASFAQDDHHVDLEITSNGSADAIVFWYELEMGNLVLSTAPESRLGSLHPAIQYIDPVACRAGERLPLCLRLRDTRLSLLSIPPPARMRSDSLPGWYLPMLADAHRESAYRAAIHRAVARIPDARVLHPGTGCASQAIATKQAGAAEVVATGHVPALARVGAEMISLNDVDDSVRLIARDMRRLSIPEDMPSRANMAVFDQFDCSLIGEGILHYLAHARTHLLEDGARILPATAVLRGRLIEYRFDRLLGLDASLLNPFLYSPGFVNVDADRIPWSPLSEPFEVFRFDFQTATPDPQRIRFDLDVRTQGVASAVLFWFDLRIDEESHLSNAPGAVPAGHWHQGLQFLPEVTAAPGMTLPLIAEHDGSALKFAWDPEAIDRSHLVPMPRFDPRTAMAAAELEQRTRDLLQHCAQAPEERRRVAEIAMRVAVDPGAHRVDPVIAQRFLSLLMNH